MHVWVYAQNTDSLLVQKRAACKDSWPNLWDVSAAGHGMYLRKWLVFVFVFMACTLNRIAAFACHAVSLVAAGYCMLLCSAVTAGDQSLETAQRETEEELGLKFPPEVSTCFERCQSRMLMVHTFTQSPARGYSCSVCLRRHTLLKSCQAHLALCIPSSTLTAPQFQTSSWSHQGSGAAFQHATCFQVRRWVLCQQ